MEPPTSSLGTIPEKRLKIWKIFSHPGPEGKEILERVKLAHAFENEGFVVTMDDETYSFLRDDGGRVKIIKIPELCGLRVKEFITGVLCLALTEDGRLYSWRSKVKSSVDAVPKNGFFLGGLLNKLRTKWRQEFFSFHEDPVAVTGSLTGEKVMQAAAAVGYVLVVTLVGDAYRWIWKGPPGERLDYKKVISVACNAYLMVVLTEDGEVFQRAQYGKAHQKAALRTSSPIKKITASESTIFALAVDGSLHSWFYKSVWSEPIWTRVSQYTNVQDIATCATEDVCVLELKTDSRFARYVGNRAPWRAPFFTKSDSLDEAFAEICQTSYRTMLVTRDPEPRKLGLDISNLWRTKKNADVTFSVQGKLVTAHKFILTMRSEYFEKMFSGDWAEAVGSVVYIKGTKHGIFEGLLFYIYHDRIPFSKLDYVKLFDLMKLADSYCEVTIRQECEKILMENINRRNAFFLLRNAASANALDLEEKVTKVMLDNRLFGETLSSAELVDLLGRDAFDKLAMAALYRN